MATLYTQPGSPYFYYDYRRGGKRYRRSTGKTDRQAAEDVMAAAIAKHAAEGPPTPGKLTLADLRRLIVEDYELNNRKSTDEVKRHFRRFSKHFGATCRASRIDTRAVREYARKRSKAGRATATINRELAALRRAFNLAKEQGTMGSVPVIRALEERNTRTEFLAPDEFTRLYKALPHDLQPLARVGYVTGWRRGELLSRCWRNVDLRGGWLRLEPNETKNREGRQFPLTDVLVRELTDQHNRADELWGKVSPGAPLFFRTVGPHKGQRIARFGVAWRKAAKAAGLEGIIFHDLRRSAVRNLVRDGVSETVAMRLTGHKTRAVFERYNIVNERDLLEAMDKMNARLKR